MPGVLGTVFLPGAIHQQGLSQDSLEPIDFDHKVDLLLESLVHCWV
jgi:hypothetical protein